MTVFEDNDGKLRNGWACCPHVVRAYEAGGWFSGVHLVFHGYQLFFLCDQCRARVKTVHKDDFMVVLEYEFVADEHLMRRFDETHPGESLFEIVTAVVEGGQKPLTLP